MEHEERTPQPATSQTAAQAPAPAAGGVAAVGHLLQQGVVVPGAAAELLARYPADRDAMLELLHNTLGNAFVQAVAEILHGRERVSALEADHTFDQDAFHGTSSAMLPGLAASDGRLLSSARLGDARTTGEGDAFGARDADAPQDFVSVGLGAPGLGVAQAYADAAHTFTHFDTTLYSDGELATQIDELTFLVGHYDDLHLDLASFPNGRLEKFQFAQRLDQLVRERSRRALLPADDPVRQGGSSDRFPIAFELDAAGATAFNQLPAGMALAGDAGITGEVDLRKRLRRVFCPIVHVAEVRAKLSPMLGRDVEIIPTESLDALAPGGDAARTHAATLTTLAALEAGFQRFVRAYADAARTGTTIDADYLIERVWQA